MIRDPANEKSSAGRKVVDGEIRRHVSRHLEATQDWISNVDMRALCPPLVTAVTQASALGMKILRSTNGWTHHLRRRMCDEPFLKALSMGGVLFFHRVCGLIAKIMSRLTTLGFFSFFIMDLFGINIWFFLALLNNNYIYLYRCLTMRVILLKNQLYTAEPLRFCCYRSPRTKAGTQSAGAELYSLPPTGP